MIRTDFMKQYKETALEEKNYFKCNFNTFVI